MLIKYLLPLQSWYHVTLGLLLCYRALLVLLLWEYYLLLWNSLCCTYYLLYFYLCFLWVYIAKIGHLFLILLLTHSLICTTRTFLFLLLHFYLQMPLLLSFLFLSLNLYDNFLLLPKNLVLPPFLRKFDITRCPNFPQIIKNLRIPNIIKLMIENPISLILIRIIRITFKSIYRPVYPIYIRLLQILHQIFPRTVTFVVPKFT